MRNHLRVLILLTLLATSAISLSPIAAQATTTLIVWDSYTLEQDQVMVEQLDNQFQSAHPGVTVQREGYKAGDLIGKLPEALAREGIPDVAMIPGQTALDSLKQSDLLLALDDYAQKYHWNNNAPEGDSLYGVPATVSIVGMFYNHDVFNRFGLQVPLDWETFSDELDTIKAGGYIPVTFAAQDGALDPYSALVEANSDIGDLTPLLTHADGATFLTEGVLEGTQTFSDWIDGGYFSPNYLQMDNAAALAEFTGGKSAMWLANSPNSGAIISALGDDHVGFFLLPSPIGDKVAPTVSRYGADYAIAKASPNADIAAQYIDFMTGSTVAANALFADGYLPLAAVDSSNIQPNTLSADLIDAWATIQSAKEIGFPLDQVLPDIGSKIQQLLSGKVEAEPLVDALDQEYQAKK
ncbi:MAG TPA: extracellular solute-binding protein [Phototrophicaceae bacterium]|nr:extracellular solute-binding protein [Phototrophicaceae bacterium]